MSDDICDPANPDAATRQLAFQLWEAAGCPDGRAEEFWHAAQRQLGIQPAERRQVGSGQIVGAGPSGQVQTDDQDNLNNNVSTVGP